MKKLLFALLMLLGVVAFAPKAEAGQYAKIWNGHCYTYVHKSQAYGYGHGGYYAPRYRNNYYRPVNRYYGRPVRYSRGYDRGCYGGGYYNSRPRVAISFGF